jgi:hypothetical protein
MCRGRSRVRVRASSRASGLASARRRRASILAAVVRVSRLAWGPVSYYSSVMQWYGRPWASEYRRGVNRQLAAAARQQAVQDKVVEARALSDALIAMAEIHSQSFPAATRPIAVRGHEKVPATLSLSRLGVLSALALRRVRTFQGSGHALMWLEDSLVRRSRLRRSGRSCARSP